MHAGAGEQTDQARGASPTLDQPPTRHRLGPVEIAWPPETLYPIALDHTAPREIWLVTLCEISFRRGPFTLRVPRGFRFDGATIPRVFWCVPGFAPVGRHLWAALAHDRLCVLAARGQVDRQIADAVFSTILRHSLTGWRGLVMSAAVTLYRALARWRTHP